MKISTAQLLEDLKQQTQQNLVAAKALQKLPESQLNKKPNAESWSALECVEHLNRYGEFYIPEINKRLDGAKLSAKGDMFSSGWLGNKFAKMMQPDEKPMKTFANMNPENSARTMVDLEKFVEQQHQILTLLQRCNGFDLSRIKTSITISKFIKIRLGDTLRVVIYHNKRHVLQAQRAVQV